MIINSSRFVGKDDDLLVIFLKDDNGNEIERYSFYLNENNSKLDRELKNSIQQLPNLLEDIYKKGLLREKIDFKNDVVNIE